MSVRVLDVKRKTPGRTVIAHVSDLHGRQDTNYLDATWKALEVDLRKAAGSVDLLIASGDLIDSGLTERVGRKWRRSGLENATRYLSRNLCDALAINPETSLCIVAGNHDYRVQGLFVDGSRPALFRELCWKYSGHRLYPSLNMACFAFDSNADSSRIGLATGLVAKTSLLDLADEVARLEKTPEWSGLAKVAILHHHPMPIGPTEHRDSMIGLPEHMLLKNAGQFLTEIVQAKFDLVLHGHQHYPAVSKACYPTGDNQFHTVCVIGAGSVGVGRPPSYYLITVTDKGETLVDHRELTNVTYASRSLRRLTSYDEARLHRIEPLLNRIERDKRISIDHYARFDRIMEGSGDEHVFEQFVGVSADTDVPVPSLSHSLKSPSGLFGNRSYRSLTSGQEVDWKWLGRQQHDERKGETRFVPPLSEDKKIAYERVATVFNAIHFNRRDRRDALGRDENFEYIRVRPAFRCGALTVQCTFPMNHWPLSFRVEATDPDGATDAEETEYASRHLSTLTQPRLVTLAVPRPLPDYVYTVIWPLPDQEKDDLNLSAADIGLADEIVERLEQATANRERQNKLVQSLQAFRRQLDDAFAGNVSDSSLELTLLAYVESARGLKPVAALDHDPQGGALDSWVLRVGRGVEGQAYRRRETVVNLDCASGESCYQDLPDSTLKPHRVCIGVPIFFPLSKSHGRRVAVLRIATRSNVSPLLRIADDGAAVAGLAQYTLTWFAREVGPSLGLDIAPPA